MYNSINDTIITGVIGVGSAAAVTFPAQSEMATIVGVICSAIVAIAHIVFGYLIYKESKKRYQ